MCAADRLPAEALETAVRNALIATVGRDDLVLDAIRAAHAAAHAGQDQLRGRLDALEGEVAKTETAIDRYLCAFETGSLTEATCGQRMQRHAKRLAELRASRANLQADLDSQDVPVPSPADLRLLRERIAEALDAGPDHARKTVFQELVHEIRVESRQCIRPAFRISNGHGPTVSGFANHPERWAAWDSNPEPTD